MKIAKYCLAPALIVLAMSVRVNAQTAPSSVPNNITGRTASYVSGPAQTGFIDLLLGAEYTDNALLSSGPRTRDGIGEAGLDVDYARQGNLSLALLGNVVRLDYVHHTFPGNFYGHFFGSAMFGKSSDPLQWQLRDAFGEATPDPLAAPTPQNLEVINDVSTGPLVNLHFGLTNRLTLDGNYSRTTYQRSPFDSQTYGGGVQFMHALSGVSSLAIEASTAKTQYLQGAALRIRLGGPIPSYTIRQAFVSYSSKFVRTNVMLNVGYNTIGYESGPTRGAPLYELDVSHRITPFSTVTLSGQSSYSTNGSSLGAPQTQMALQAGASLSPAYSVAEPYNQRLGTLGWIFHRARTRVLIMGTVEQVIFDHVAPAGLSQSPYNDNYVEEGGDLMIGRQLRPSVSIQLRASADALSYSNLNASTRRESVQLTFSKQFRRAAIWVYAERLHESGVQGVSTFLAASYNDDVVGFYVTFDLLGQRPPGSSIGGTPSLTGMGFIGGY